MYQEPTPSELAPQEVLTVFACGVLFGRTAQSIRTAARKEFVNTEFSFSLDPRQDARLITLESAVAYWGKGDSNLRQQIFQVQLEDMRQKAIEISINQGSMPDGTPLRTRLKVLHSEPIVRQAMTKVRRSRRISDE